jgi:hypothetical protein
VVLFGLAVAGGLCLVQFCVCCCSVSLASQRSCASLPFVVAALSCCALSRSLCRYVTVSCNLKLCKLHKTGSYGAMDSTSCPILCCVIPFAQISHKHTEPRTASSATRPLQGIHKFILQNTVVYHNQFLAVSPGVCNFGGALRTKPLEPWQ